MVYCCVPCCTSDTSKNEDKVSFHQFPRDVILKGKWISAISRQGNKLSALWSPSEFSRVCSRHFKESDFSVSTARKRLLPDKTPTIFPGYPPHKVKTTSERRKLFRRSFTPPVYKKAKKTNDDDFDPDTSQTCSLSPESSPGIKEVGIQVSSSIIKRNLMTRKYLQVKKCNYRLRNTVNRLKKKLKLLHGMKTTEKSKLHDKIKELQENSDNGDLKASFILEQVEAYGKKWVSYKETTLKVCVLWQRKAPSGYKYFRSLNILHIPHSKTLKNYIGFTNSETGITSLIRQRLHYEFRNLTCANEKLGSLIIDEMSIKARVTYDRNLDQFLGYTEDEIENLGRTDRVANKLLCFMFRGLSTAFRIPVAFYFTRHLSGTQLNILTSKVISEVEETGFQILRIVTDNCSVNVNMMKEMCNGVIQPEIPHPRDKNRPLFLSFDSSHILKNIRSQFLQRDFLHEGKVISSSYLKELYELQRNLIVKPIRCLTRKTLFPSNLEKMNVKRAKYLFSSSVTAALMSLPNLAPEKVKNNDNLQKTIEFLENVRKWHDIHDICNLKQACTSRNLNKEVFAQVDDERLLWLTNDFLPFIAELQKSKSKANRLSKETEEALILTTQSTVRCIKYLLSAGFHYILSRNLNSDDLELLFSHLRRRGGFNDMLDVRSCLYAMNITLKTGMVNPADSSNVERQTFQTLNSIREQRLQTEVQENRLSIVLPEDVLSLLDKPIEEEPITMELSSLAMVGGYLVRVAEENTQCSFCIELLSSVVSDSPLMCLVKAQDRGALRYPSRKFVFFLKLVLTFTKHAIKYVGKFQVLKKLKVLLTRKFKSHFQCTQCDQERVSDIIVTKFLKPILDNQARNVTENVDVARNFVTKPLSRKVHKL